MIVQDHRVDKQTKKYLFLTQRWSKGLVCWDCQFILEFSTLSNGTNRLNVTSLSVCLRDWNMCFCVVSVEDVFLLLGDFPSNTELLQLSLSICMHSGPINACY